LSNVLILPTPNPLGVPTEYAQQLDGTWQQIPTGSQSGENTLTIPSQLYEPRGIENTFNVYSGDCGDTGNVATSCAAIIHEANLGAVFNIAAGVRPQGDCVDELISSGDFANSVAFYQAQNGAPLSNIYPAWYLQALRDAGQLPPEREAIGLIFDWATIWCFPVSETLPGFIIPQTATLPTASWCKPPGVIVTRGAAQICQFDPPVPSHFPLAYVRFPRRFGSQNAYFKAHAQLDTTRAAIARALNPTVNPGRPRTIKSCGCDGPDFTEAIDA